MVCQIGEGGMEEVRYENNIIITVLYYILPTQLKFSTCHKVTCGCHLKFSMYSKYKHYHLPPHYLNSSSVIM